MQATAGQVIIMDSESMPVSDTIEPEPNDNIGSGGEQVEF